MDARILKPQTSERSLVGLISELWRDSAELIRSEIELAKTEFVDTLAQARFGIVSVALGGTISLIGVVFLLQSLVELLALILPEDQAPWLSPLIVGGCVVLAGAGLLYLGIRQLTAGASPMSQVRRSVQQDAQLVKDHIS